MGDEFFPLLLVFFKSFNQTVFLGSIDMAIYVSKFIVIPKQRLFYCQSQLIYNNPFLIISIRGLGKLYRILISFCFPIFLETLVNSING